MKKIKKLLLITIVAILPLHGFNAIAMEERKPEETELNSTNGISVRPNHRNLPAPLAISEEEKKRGAQAQLGKNVNFVLKILGSIVFIFWSISKIIVNHRS
jgi:hypothetical protein